MATKETEVQEVKAPSTPLVDPNARQLVQMPTEDVYGYEAPTFRINAFEFKPGHTYSLRAELAGELRNRISIWETQRKKLVMAQSDKKAQAAVMQYGAAAASGTAGEVEVVG